VADPVRIEAVGAARIFTIDRPDARNAMSVEIAEACLSALDALEADRSVRTLILTGAGNAAFVSGADLKFLRSATAEQRAHMDARMLTLLCRIEALDLPVIAALNGAVVGGGMEVALAADLRIAEPHVSLIFKHAAMGVTPGWGGLGRLAACVGRSTAARLLLTALPLSAEDALRVQLIDEIARGQSALARALVLAQAVEQTSPATVRALKGLLRSAYGAPLSLAEEQRVFIESTHSADHAEALRAFFEKRAPRFDPR
jgi:enoyl-CoA hydratase/carnithine racemase